MTQLELGGAQRSTLQLLARLDRRRFVPTLLSSDGWLTETARRIPGLSVTLLPGLRREIAPLHDTRTLARLTAFIRRGRYEIVHTHSSKAGVLGRWAAHLARTPAIVHTIHGFGFHDFQPVRVRRLYEWLERCTSRVTDGFIAVSERDRDTGLRRRIGRPSQYRLIRYGIEAERFRTNGAPREAVRRSLGLEPHRPVIGTVACLKPQKAPLDFVRACALIARRIPEAQFVIIGDGVLRPDVERLRRREGLERSLHLPGWRDDVPKWLAAMEVFVLTSRWEGLPIACLEAMASGLPIVATPTGGIPEIVTHGANGLLAPVAQPGRTAEAVVRLLRDESLRRRMGETGRASLNGQFTLERMVGATERFYGQLCGGKSDARTRWEDPA